MSEKQEIEDLVLEEDMLIHIGGLPFELRAGSVVRGLPSNFEGARAANRQNASRKLLKLD